MRLFLFALLSFVAGSFASEPDSTRANHLTQLAITRESDCKALLDYKVAGDCLESIRANKEFKITAEENSQVMEQRISLKPAPHAFFDPSPPIPDSLASAQESLSSIAGSLRFMAVIAGIEAAVGLVFLFIAIQ